MARETKVGLLAGLAFIVCFAIILTNRGHQSRIPQQLAYLPDRTVERPLSFAKEFRHASAGPRSTLPRTPWRVDSAPTSGAATPFARPTTKHRQQLPAIRTDGQNASGTQQPSPSNAMGRLSSTTRSVRNHSTMHALADSSDIDARSALERRLNDLSRERSASQENVKKTPKNSTSSKPRVASSRLGANARRHVVASGDTLTKIATIHYGSRSQSLVQALFEANRSVLSSPDELRVGMQLVVPAVEGTNRSAAHSARSNPANLAKSPRKTTQRSETAPPAQSNRRWYQIKPGDRYVTIARRELGDAARWHEIHELNKAKFPDPGLIREGVRIMLPVTRPSGVTRLAGGRR